MKDAGRLMQALNYQFSKPELLLLAMRHPSLGKRNNQRLEFLGDAVLQLTVSDLLYQASGKLSEGQLTRRRAALVCEESLFSLAERLHLDDYLLSLPPLGPESPGRQSMLADAMEALLGAVYLDGGYGAAREIVRRLLGDLEAPNLERLNHKNRLQEKLVALGRSEPEYETLLAQGPAHKRLFTVQVTVDGVALAQAEGSSKKAAEQAAAGIALQALEGMDEA